MNAVEEFFFVFDFVSSWGSMASRLQVRYTYIMVMVSISELKSILSLIERGIIS